MGSREGQLILFRKFSIFFWILLEFTKANRFQVSCCMVTLEAKGVLSKCFGCSV